jgi:hypothetical protein
VVRGLYCIETGNNELGDRSEWPILCLVAQLITAHSRGKGLSQGQKGTLNLKKKAHKDN